MKASQLVGIMSFMGMMAKETTGYSYILDDDEEFNKMIRDDLLRDAVETIEDMNNGEKANGRT